MVGIYKVTNNIDGMIYIGQSCEIEKRWIKHKSHQIKTYFSSALFKHGVENFSWDIIELCDDSLLNEREMFWINVYSCKVPNGYNMTDGGTLGTKGHKHSKESKEKMSKAKIGYKRTEESLRKASESLRGAGSHMFGKHWDDATKKKMSDAKMGANNVSSHRIEYNGIIFESKRLLAKYLGIGSSSVTYKVRNGTLKVTHLPKP